MEVAGRSGICKPSVLIVRMGIGSFSLVEMERHTRQQTFSAYISILKAHFILENLHGLDQAFEDIEGISWPIPSGHLIQVTRIYQPSLLNH